jgi:hypothetical protein
MFIATVESKHTVLGMALLDGPQWHTGKPTGRSEKFAAAAYV